MYSPRSVSTGVMPLRVEVRVDPELLGDHRLALGHRARAGVAADLQHGRARLVGGAAPMHVAAGALDVGGELLEVEVEIGQRVVLDVARRCRAAARTPAGWRRRRCAAP